MYRKIIKTHLDQRNHLPVLFHEPDWQVFCPVYYELTEVVLTKPRCENRL